MKEITKFMIKEFKIQELGFDMMGYTFQRTGDLSYHHLIIPHRHGGPMTFENGAILRQNTSHDYLHTIERIDYDMFCAITSELIDENILRRIEISNLKYIRDILLQFEREHCSDRTKKGHLVIKPEYIERRIKL